MKKFIATSIAAVIALSIQVGGASAASPVKVVPQTCSFEINKGQIQSLLTELNQYSNKLPSELQEIIKKQLNDRLVGKLQQPAVKEPQKPVTAQPEKPAVKEPQKPVTQQPQQPAVKKPQKPATQQPQQPVVKEPTQQQAGTISQQEQQMVNLVNQERAKAGLQPLKVNEELVRVARVKAQDMIDKNYFAHQSPTYGSPFEMMSKFGIQYNTAGENLAGNRTVEAAHQALMNSDGHRANILNSNFKEIGIGIVEGGPYGKMFVQLFKG